MWTCTVTAVKLKVKPLAITMGCRSGGGADTLFHTPFEKAQHNWRTGITQDRRRGGVIAQKFFRHDATSIIICIIQKNSFNDYSSYRYICPPSPQVTPIITVNSPPSQSFPILVLTSFSRLHAHLHRFRLQKFLFLLIYAMNFKLLSISTITAIYYRAFEQSEISVTTPSPIIRLLQLENKSHRYSVGLGKLIFDWFLSSVVVMKRVHEFQRVY